MSRLKSLCGLAVMPLLVAVAALALTKVLGGVAVADVASAISATTWASVALSLLFCVLSYMALTGYDWFAATHVGLKVSYARIALGSFLSYGFANSIGFALLVGGAVRMRIYAGDGATRTQIAYLTAICGLTFALAGGVLVSGTMLLWPSVAGLVVPLPPLALQLLGGAGLAIVALYLRWVSLSPRRIGRHGLTVELPGAGVTLKQIAVGAADLVFACTALYVLLPSEPAIGWAGFIGLFAAAMTMGYLSHVPGGVGIFEALILVALPDIPPGELLASLIVYRCLYYLLPLAVASALFGAFEIRKAGARVPVAKRERPDWHRLPRAVFRSHARSGALAGAMTS